MKVFLKSLLKVGKVFGIGAASWAATQGLESIHNVSNENAWTAGLFALLYTVFDWYKHKDDGK